MMKSISIGLMVLFLAYVMTFNYGGCNLTGDSGSSGPIPNAPSNLITTLVSPSQINLSWTDNSNNETGFKIERSNATGGIYTQIDTVSVNITSYSNTGLIDGVIWYYRVCAYNANGNSVYSNEASTSISLNAPTNLVTTTITSSQIGIQWTDNSTGNSGFKIERKIGPGGTYTQIATVGADITYYSDTEILDGIYYYRVRAYNTEYNSTYSNEIFVTPFPYSPSLINTTVISATQINLSWTDNSHVEDGFKIERRTVPGGNYTQVAMAEANVISYSDTGLVDGTKYYYQIRAYNTSGDSGYSDEAFGITSSIWKQAACGNWHTLAVKNDCTLWGWGWNGFGQLGDGTSGSGNYKTSPTQVGTATNWTQVSCGYNYTIALKTDGTLWAWGANDSGQLGQYGSTADEFSPVQIGTDTNWQQVACGYAHAVALKTDGTLWTWGNNYYGQLGDGTSGSTNYRTSPYQVITATNWQLVAGGDGHTIALKTDGTLWSCGRNNYGQLGLGSSDTNPHPDLSQIGTDTNWQSVTCGACHTLAIKTTGTLWAWGKNNEGQLGDETTFERSSPVQIGTAINWLSIAGGLGHSLAVKTDGTLWTWGYNYYGQLGDGTAGTGNYKTSPIQIGTATNWQSVAGGGAHSSAIKTDSSLWTWGWNQYGQLGDGTGGSKTVPVQILR